MADEIQTFINNVAELLTNSVNMVSVYYDIFLNPVPMDVQLQQFNDENELITITIPNRAKDRKIALEGNGSPEGVVTAVTGTAYINLSTSEVYFKILGDGNTGWQLILTEAAVQPVIAQYLEDNEYITRPALRTYLITNKYYTEDDVISYLVSNEYVVRPTMENYVENYLENTHASTTKFGSVKFDGETITAGTGDEAKVIAVTDSKQNVPLKFWTGTKGEYDSIITKDPSTIYVLTTNGAIFLGANEIGSRAGRNVGEIVPSLIPLNDAKLHLMDGTRIEGSGSYKDFVDYIADLYGDGTNIPSYFCTQAEFDSSVETYGSCGKFVYDPEANTLRLPQISDILQGTTDVTALGDLIEAGLPNIIGEAGSWERVGLPDLGTGAFSFMSYGSGYSGGYGGGVGGAVNFDASRSSSIYGNSNTVQPQVIKVLFYICVGSSVKTSIEVDIDNIMADLDAKVNTDLSNLPANSQAVIASWGMPDYTKAYSIGSPGVAASDGYIYVYGAAVEGSVSIGITIDGMGMNINGTLTNREGGHYPGGVFPIAKGSSYSTWGSVSTRTFIPCKTTETGGS